jgi:ABC-type multidrug transport system fused ATPase/permease subunit
VYALRRELFAHLQRLSLSFHTKASAERISEGVLDVEPEITDRPDAVEATALTGTVEFDRVSFDYGDGRAVLREVSFTVPAGQRLALVGPSGAGKSTIASLILRLYEPQSGTIRIDGVDIRDCQIRTSRSKRPRGPSTPTTSFGTWSAATIP